MTVSFLYEVLNNKLILKRNGSSWLVEEDNKNSNNKELSLIGCGTSIVFSLDRNGDSFPFIKSSTKKGMRTVSDAIIIFTYKEETYFCVLDMKSSNISNGFSQIEAGRFFLEWILGLGHYNKHTLLSEGTKGRFFGVLSLKERRRRQVRKRTTSRRADLPSPSISPCKKYPVFTIDGQSRLDLSLLIQSLIERKSI